MLLTLKIEKVSQSCFVFDVVKFNEYIFNYLSMSGNITLYIYIFNYIYIYITRELYAYIYIYIKSIYICVCHGPVASVPRGSVIPNQPKTMETNRHHIISLSGPAALHNCIYMDLC